MKKKAKKKPVPAAPEAPKPPEKIQEYPLRIWLISANKTTSPWTIQGANDSLYIVGPNTTATHLEIRRVPTFLTMEGAEGRFRCFVVLKGRLSMYPGGRAIIE